MFSTPGRTATTSLITVIVLVVVKAVVGFTTGSISILAQAADSALDLIAVTITLLTIRATARPADEQHPFGHGKLENLAALAQAGLIFAAAGTIIVSAVQRIINGTIVTATEPGIIVMAFSIGLSIWLSRNMIRVARSSESLVLEGNAGNIAADIYSAASVLAALLLVRFTGWNILDPILAIVVSAVILKSGVDILSKSFGGLVDIKLPEAEEKIIRDAIAAHKEVVGFHKLRTRMVGNQHQVDLHLLVPGDEKVGEAHLVCDQLEREIAAKLTRTRVVIHLEPAENEPGGERS